MRLEERILAIGQATSVIADRLNSLGYLFETPSAVFPGPEPDTDAAIARIEHEVGPLPLCLMLFWRLIGNVNFMGQHPQWRGCDYPDALVVFPTSTALSELDDFLADREERLRCDFPYVVPISPDDKHKENVSGAAPYTIDVPAAADDPQLNGEPHQTTFVGYLQIALRWGGFPGLENSTSHRWPLARLINTLGKAP